MHNIKDIRNNLDLFKNSLKKRNVKINIDEIINLDQINRKLIQEKEILEKEKKDISKSKDQSLFNKSKAISKKIDELSKKQTDTKLQLDILISNIPNIPLEDVPVGNDENSI